MKKRILLVVCCASLLGCLSVTASQSENRVQQIKIVADKAPDNSSLASIVESVTRGCKSNDDKAIALYNYCILTMYHRAYPREQGGIPSLKLFNVYGWSLCGGLHTAEASLWDAAGWKWRFVSWTNPGHTTVEAFYDNKWHYLDAFLKFYALAKNSGGHVVAGQADIKADPGLVTRDMVEDAAHKPLYHFTDNDWKKDGKPNWMAPAFLVCGDSAAGVITGVNSSRESGSIRSWPVSGIKFDNDGYTTDVNLAPGESLELMWKAIAGAHWFVTDNKQPDGRKTVPMHGEKDKDARNCPVIGPVLEPYIDSNLDGPKEALGGRTRTFASGKLMFAPDLNSDAFMAGLAAKDNVKWSKGVLNAASAATPGSITVRLQSPYVMTRATGKAEGADTIESSTDGGKSFSAIDLANFDDAVGGKYDVLVKIGFKQLRSLELDVTVQHNRCALPYLSPGKNTIAVSLAKPAELGANKLVVTYAYCTGSRDCSYEQLVEKGSNIASGQGAKWSTTPTVVQKVFAAKDLPATFDILVPTPKDKYPVYPRMLFLRREVIGPESKPMPLPDGATPPAVGAGDELKTLPNPFLIGTAVATR